MRKASIKRKTKETNISLDLNLDGRGSYSINTSIPFIDHMLSLMCKHGLFDMKLKAKGDIDIDDHHTVEDIGIVLGKAPQTGSRRHERHKPIRPGICAYG